MEADFAGVNYNEYGKWSQVKVPGGQVYYKIPSAPGWVYDPFLSASKGRPVIWQDPTASMAEKQKAEEEVKRQQKKAEDAASPVNQVIPVAGSIAGLYAANKLINPSAAAAAAPTLTNTGSTIGTGLGQAAAAGAAQLPTGFIPGVSALPEAVGVGSSVGGTAGSVITSGGTEMMAAEAPLGSLGSVGPYLGVAGAGLGAYGVYEGIKNKDPMTGAIGGAGLGAGLAAAAPLAGLGPVGWGTMGLMALGGALGGGGLAGLAGMGDKDMWKTEGNRLRDLQSQGFNVSQGLIDAMPKAGRSKEQLIREAEATGDQPTIDFAKTRDEGFLTAPQIQGYSSVYERAGKNATDADRARVAQEAVDANKALGGVIREHHGTIDIDWGKVDQYNNEKKKVEVTAAPRGGDRSGSVKENKVVKRR